MLLLNSVGLGVVLVEVHRWGWESAELKWAEKVLVENLAVEPGKVELDVHVEC